MPIDVARLSNLSAADPTDIWEVQLSAVADQAYPKGWHQRCPVYRFESQAAAEAFIRLKVESACSPGESGLIELRAVACRQA